MKVREDAFKYYFYFMQERMNIFWKRFEGHSSHLTKDQILLKHKFTNVYRAQDRVSQYLIKDVIYNQEEDFTEIDILLRIIIFKIFNNIDTWLYLQEKLGVITVKNFNVDYISKLLTDRIKEKSIFSGAYMMTGSHQKYHTYKSKHEKWLRMVDQELLKERRFNKILQANSLAEIFTLLLECSFIGDFLAYQYTIDFNYSDVINFDENSFVKAGIGSIRGIKKCFSDFNGYSFEDCIRYTQDNLETFQQRYDFTGFKDLFGRTPQLIDLQNCFCETDKYLRVKMPQLQIDNIRIKQKFTKPKNNIDYFFPPKWNINLNMKKCITPNLKELTLF